MVAIKGFQGIQGILQEGEVWACAQHMVDDEIAMSC